MIWKVSNNNNNYRPFYRISHNKSLLKSFVTSSISSDLGLKRECFHKGKICDYTLGHTCGDTRHVVSFRSFREFRTMCFLIVE